MLFRETVAVYCENRTEHTATLCVGGMQSFNVLKRVVHVVITGLLSVQSESFVHINSFSFCLAKLSGAELADLAVQTTRLNINDCQMLHYGYIATLQ
jgi:hypothetical protein